MSNQHKVWQFADCDVLIYLEESDFYSTSYSCVTTESGTPVSGFEVDLASDHPSYVPPLFKYCYLNSGDVNGDQTIQTRLIPGRKKPVLSGEAFRYSMSIEHLYFDKDDEIRLEDVFRSNQNLRIAMRARNQEKRDNPIYHVLKSAKAVSFRISGRDADMISVSVNFNAEDFYIVGD